MRKDFRATGTEEQVVSLTAFRDPMYSSPPLGNRFFEVGFVGGRDGEKGKSTSPSWQTRKTSLLGRNSGRCCLLRSPIDAPNRLV